jgi:hypothetical protein
MQANSINFIEKVHDTNEPAMQKEFGVYEDCKTRS